MKTIEIEKESRPLTEWLPIDNGGEPIYLTRAGRTEFVIVPFDEGDEEVLAMRKNPELMEYIARAVERARKGPTKSSAEIKKKFGIED